MFQWNIFAYLYEGEYFCRNNANYKKTLVNLQQNVDGRSHWEVIRHLSVWNEFYYQAASAEICLEVQITLEEFLLCKYELTFFNYYFLNSNEDLPHFFFSNFATFIVNWCIKQVAFFKETCHIWRSIRNQKLKNHIY